MTYKDTTQRIKSKMFRLVRGYIKELFPGWVFTEGCWIKFEGRDLELDIFITGPLVKMIIEVDGRQHYEYVERFHGNRFEFEDQQYRDKLKEEYADINELKFLRIKENLKMTKQEFKQLVFKAIRV